MQIVSTHRLGEYVFREYTNHGFSDHAGKTLWKFEIDGGQAVGFNELYETLDYAMVAAVGQKYTGRRGASGDGVGTAADWFMKMIGADKPTRKQLIDHTAKNKYVVAIAEDAGAPNAEAVVEDVVDAMKRFEVCRKD